MGSNEINPLKAIQRIKEKAKTTNKQGGVKISKQSSKPQAKANNKQNVKPQAKTNNKQNTKQNSIQNSKQTGKAANKQKQNAKQAPKQQLKESNKQSLKQVEKANNKLGINQNTRPISKKKEKPINTQTKQSKLPKLSSIIDGYKFKMGSKVKIIPLGGLEQIGMNITAFEYKDSIFVVDCGLAFPSEDMPGIDLVIPDITYLKDNFSKVKGFVITHGHEDHIGALPYVLKQLNVPVYSTRLTNALIEKKLVEHKMEDTAKLHVVKYGESINFGDFRVEFVKTNHSIQDAAALAIFTPAGIIFHTGDFKVDYTPIFGDPIDLQRMAELGRQGVLALMCDSTNATKPGFTMSERTVGKTFNTIFEEHRGNRIIVATFASNVDRVQQIIDTACKYNRKVVVEGRSMVNVIGVASELGYISIPDGTLIDIENLKNYKPEDTVIITTGSQGESMAALSRMASSTHKKVSIMPTDVIIMSSTPIPGNEKAVSRVINELSMKGAEVIFQDTHVSGHACQEDIKLMYALLHPRYSLPVHGEYRHLAAQRALAIAMGVPKDNVLLMNSGDVVELSQSSCEITGKVQAGGILVDGLGVGDVGNVVLKDRQNLSQNGIIIVAMTLEHGTNRLLAGPDIVSRGFVYIKESEDLLEEAREVVREEVEDCVYNHVGDWSKIKGAARDVLSDFIWKRMKRTPLILPIIMEVY